MLGLEPEPGLAASAAAAAAGDEGEPRTASFVLASNSEASPSFAGLCSVQADEFVGQAAFVDSP